MVALVEPLAAGDPEQVGGFRLKARLGAGGMGRVYLGYSPGGRPVAVKVVHPDLARDPEFMQRFRREVAAAQTVSDAYTAAVVGAGPDDSPPWLVTTYVAGPPLADLVGRAGPLPEDAVWRLAGGLAEALQAIHAQGLVHRDLKPGNILVAADGPRVIDFGISRATGGTVLTATQTTIGTPAYMSPEQAEGRTVGPASDVFSLGSVLGFAAGGVAPFGGGEMFAIGYRVVHGEPDLSRVPASLHPLIGGCLAKDPAARPALSQLMRAVSAGSARFPPVTPGKFWPDQVEAVLASNAFTHVLPPFTPVPLPAPATDLSPPSQYSPTNVSQPSLHSPTNVAPPQQRRRRPRWLLPLGLAVAVVAGAGVAIALALQPSPKPPAYLSGTASATASPASSSAVSSAAASSPAPSSSPTAVPATTSAGSTAPAGTVAAGSLTTVTVCTAPADGCVAGAKGDMATRPGQIDLAADGTGYVNSLNWDNWGSAQATAEGTLYINDCQPNCASGKFTGYLATVTLSRLTGYGASGSGLGAYASIVVTAPTSPNKVITFTKDTVPA
jgi:serine/threonine protein kinase